MARIALNDADTEKTLTLTIPHITTMKVGSAPVELAAGSSGNPEAKDEGTFVPGQSEINDHSTGEDQHYDQMGARIDGIEQTERRVDRRSVSG